MIDQLNQQQEQRERELQRFLVEHEAEKKQLIMRREDLADEQRWIDSRLCLLHVRVHWLYCWNYTLSLRDYRVHNQSDVTTSLHLQKHCVFHASEVICIVLHRRNRSSTLRRALLAENESQRLSEDMQTLNRKLAGLQQELESVAGESHGHLLTMLWHNALWCLNS